MFTMAPSRPQARRGMLSMVDWARLYAPKGPPWNIIERLLMKKKRLLPQLCKLRQVAQVRRLGQLGRYLGIADAWDIPPLPPVFLGNGQTAYVSEEQHDVLLHRSVHTSPSWRAKWGGTEALFGL
jgi:hypothetical protein